AKARAMARKKKLVEAIRLLQDGLRRGASQQEKMHWRLAVVNLLLEVKKPQLALPHVAHVLSQIDTFQLERWDPELALTGLVTAWRGFNALSAPEEKAKAESVLHRIAALDPAAAMQVAK
ncbi:MAG: type VI secretion system-associated protein TagF, partial [Desulfatitalea sp.]|nr:type VI secretion system domain-containing protein [Desulfatitalea sp.]NNK02256.1 type VI secretion system-associated protein TagF [Desulfatitalea sp.]